MDVERSTIGLRACCAASLLGLLSLLVACSPTGSGPEAAPVGPSPSVPAARSASEAGPSAFDHEVSTISETLRTEVHADVIPGAVVFVRRGDQTRTLAFGLAERPTSPMRVADRFRIGSVTKTIVAAATLRLVARGRLSLSDTVEKWLPGLLQRGADITVADLLGQTSGLPEFVTRPGFDPLLRSGHGQPRDVVGLVSHRALQFTPGTRSFYSNTNYTVLGLLLEQATHRRLAGVLEQQIFAPLGMRSASLAPTGVFRPPLAHGYDRGQDVIPGYQLAWAGGAGGVIADAPDIATFFDRLLAGRVVPPPLLRKMLKMRPETSPGPFQGYGLGLASIDTPCGPAFGHGGQLPGFFDVAFTTRHGNRAVVLMVNATGTPSTSAVVGTVINLALCSR